MCRVLRIIMVSRAPPAFCGIAEYASMLLEALMRKHGFEGVFVSTHVVEGVDEYTEPYSGAEVKQCFYEDGGYRGILGCVALLDPGPDTVIHIQHEYNIFRQGEEFVEMLERLRRLADERGAGIVVTFHTVAHPIIHPDRVELQLEVGRLADAVIVHSKLMEYEFIVQGVDAEKIHLIPHGTLLNRFLGRSRERLLERLGLDPGLAKHRLITTPGFIRPNKGLTTLLRAFQIVWHEEPGTRLILIGSPQGAGARYLEAVKPLLSSSEGIVFLNRFLRRDEMLALLAAVDIAVFPYVVEKFYAVSGALHMAMGSRRPSVCTKVAKLVECNELAPEVSVPAGKYAKVAEKILTLLRDSEFAERIADRLWGYAQQTSWERVAEKHRELYESVLRV
jgi:glycosyltransferase involved in cell wall biosynthesis